MTDHHESQLDKLIRMANQIAIAIKAEAEPKAIDDTADHIRAFWTPKMRRELKDYAEKGGARLDPLALQAVTLT